MRFTILFVLFIILLSGCKKESDPPPPPYWCDCQPYGKNFLSLFINNSTALFPYENDKHRWGFIDQAGSVVIEPSYAGAWYYSNDRAMVIFDKYGVQYAGFVDATGTMAVPAKYRFITEVFYSAEGLIPIGDIKKQLVGYIDLNGGVRIPFQYTYGSTFNEGISVVYMGNKVGAIDVNGNMIVPTKYESISTFSEGLASAFRAGEKRGYLTTSGQYKFQGDFTMGTIFMYGLAAVDDPETRLVGYINNTGQFVIPAKFSGAWAFSEELAAVKFEEKWGFIDLKGNFVIEPKFEDINIGFCNGLAPVKKNSKWGYTDRSGNLVIAPQFIYADVFYCDLAKVWFVNGTVGYVNKSGTVVYQTTPGTKASSKFTKISDYLSDFNIKVGS